MNMSVTHLCIPLYEASSCIYPVSMLFMTQFVNTMKTLTHLELYTRVSRTAHMACGQYMILVWPTHSHHLSHNGTKVCTLACKKSVSSVCNQAVTACCMSSSGVNHLAPYWQPDLTGCGTMAERLWTSLSTVQISQNNFHCARPTNVFPYKYWCHGETNGDMCVCCVPSPAHVPRTYQSQKKSNWSLGITMLLPYFLKLLGSYEHVSCSGHASDARKTFCKQIMAKSGNDEGFILLIFYDASFHTWIMW